MKTRLFLLLALLATTAFGQAPARNVTVTPAGTAMVFPSAANLRTASGLVIGTNVQAYDADLATLATNSGTINLSSVTLTSPTLSAPTFSFSGQTSVTWTKGTAGTPGNPGELNELVLTNSNSGANVLALKNTHGTNPLSTLTFRAADDFEKGAIGYFGGTGPFMFLEISDIDAGATGTAPPFKILQTSSYDEAEGFGQYVRFLLDDDGTLSLHDRTGDVFFTHSVAGTLTLNPTAVALNSDTTLHTSNYITLNGGTGAAANPRLRFTTAAESGGIFSSTGQTFGITTNGIQAALWDTDGNLTNRGTIAATSITGTGLNCIAAGTAYVIIRSVGAGSSKMWSQEHTAADEFRFGYYNGSVWAYPIVGTGARITIDHVLKLVPVASPPGSPEEGDIYADTDHHLYYYNGTTWLQLDN